MCCVIWFSWSIDDIMGDIDDFFDLTKRFERYEISPGTIAGRIVSKPCAPKKLTLRDVNETTYAQKYIIENQAKLLQVYFKRAVNSTSSKNKILFNNNGVNIYIFVAVI